MTQPISRRLRQGASEIDPANGGHDQIAENKQHAGDANEAGHDEPEKRVKQKIPPAHAQAVLVGAVAIKGDEQERLAQGEMNDADEEKKPEAFPDVDWTNEKDITHEHVLDFLIPFRGAAQEQDGRRRRHDIADADDRFLRDLTRAFAGNGENRGPKQSEPKGDEEGGPAIEMEVQEDGDADA